MKSKNLVTISFQAKPAVRAALKIAAASRGLSLREILESAAIRIVTEANPNLLEKKIDGTLLGLSLSVLKGHYFGIIWT